MDSPRSASDAASTTGSFGTGFRVLVVDDEEVVRMVLGMVLRGLGFEVEDAEDLRHARARIRAGKFDLVVTDKNLPDGSGLELIREIAEAKLDCEIIMITGYGSYESALEAMKLGIGDYLSKPFDDLEDVRQRVRRVLERLVLARKAREEAATAVTLPATEPQKRLRFFVDLRVRFILVDGSLTGPAFVSSLSVTDLFVESDQPLPIGTKVRMRLYLPGMDAVDLHGLVRRHGEGKLTSGMRIDLTEVTPEQAAAIERYLAPRRRKLQGASTIVSTAAPEAAGDAVASSPTAQAADGGADDPISGLSPDVAALVRRWLHEEEPEKPASTSGESVPSLAPVAQFEPDALDLFQTMQEREGKIVQFLETLDPATVHALIKPFTGALPEPIPLTPPPAKVPAPFEKLEPAGFDPDNDEPEALPVVIGQPILSAPSEKPGEAERLRQKYNLDESLFDEDRIKAKYGIDDSLFDEGDAKGNGNGAGSAAKAATPAAAGAFKSAPPPPTVGAGGGMASRIGQTPEQRKACANELRRRGEEALGKGLVLKAASDLALALAFDDSDPSLRKLYDDVRTKANEVRADDLYRHGLQQAALGDPEAAAKLLVQCCALVYDRRYVLNCAKVLLQIRTPEALKETRTITRAAIEREPNVPELHVLLGRVAELEGFPKNAIRCFQRALELDPENASAKELLKKMEGR